VEESELIRDAELVRGFRNTLGDVSSALERTEGAVNVAIERGGNELTRLETRLAEVGLAGSHLQLKEKVLDWIVTVTGAHLRHVLKWMNSFLGSLTIVFPQLELVKECKEHLEIVVAHQHRAVPGVPNRIFEAR
jgi:hypothetical protein